MSGRRRRSVVVHHFHLGRRRTAMPPPPLLVVVAAAEGGSDGGGGRAARARDDAAGDRRHRADDGQRPDLDTERRTTPYHQCRLHRKIARNLETALKTKAINLRPAGDLGYYSTLAVMSNETKPSRPRPRTRPRSRDRDKNFSLKTHKNTEIFGVRVEAETKILGPDLQNILR